MADRLDYLESSPAGLQSAAMQRGLANGFDRSLSLLTDIGRSVGAIDTPVISEDTFKTIVGQRKIQYDPSLSYQQAVTSRDAYDRDLMYDTLSTNAGVSEKVAAFLVDMGSQLVVDPITYATAGVAAGGSIAARVFAKGLSKVAPQSGLLRIGSNIAKARESHWLRMAALEGAAAELAISPLDYRIEKGRGRDYSPESFLLAMTFGTAGNVGFRGLGRAFSNATDRLSPASNLNRNVSVANEALSSGAVTPDAHANQVASLYLGSYDDAVSLRDSLRPDSDDVFVGKRNISKHLRDTLEDLDATSPSAAKAVRDRIFAAADNQASGRAMTANWEKMKAESGFANTPDEMFIGAEAAKTGFINPQEAVDGVRTMQRHTDEVYAGDPSIEKMQGNRKNRTTSAQARSGELERHKQDFNNSDRPGTIDRSVDNIRIPKEFDSLPRVAGDPLNTAHDIFKLSARVAQTNDDKAMDAVYEMLAAMWEVPPKRTDATDAVIRAWAADVEIDAQLLHSSLARTQTPAIYGQVENLLQLSDKLHEVAHLGNMERGVDLQRQSELLGKNNDSPSGTDGVIAPSELNVIGPRNAVLASKQIDDTIKQRLMKKDGVLAGISRELKRCLQG